MRTRPGWQTLMRVCALLLRSCLLSPAKGAGSTPPSRAVARASRSPRVGTFGVELEKPIRVRSVEGVITSQSGGWPAGTFVLFELRPTREPGKLRQVKAESRGSFKVPDVPPGDYCFKATADGRQSVGGVS